MNKGDARRRAIPPLRLARELARLVQAGKLKEPSITLRQREIDLFRRYPNEGEVMELRRVLKENGIRVRVLGKPELDGL